MEKRKAIIVGAAGRDFHNFLTFFRDNPVYEVVCFTAAQLPGIEKRAFPKSLAGKMYKKDIPIYREEMLEALIEKYCASDVFFSYSDARHVDVMHIAARALSKGASFTLLGPQDTMLKSSKPVIAVCAVRTGAGKSPLTSYIAETLRKKGKEVGIIRHPMPYGNLAKQAVQRFASLSDLEKTEMTIEEKEDYERHVKKGFRLYAGVDYARILKLAEKENDVIIWDGGNNDYPFIRPDLFFCVADSLRAGHELEYYPGEVNFRMADAIVITKGNGKGTGVIENNAKFANPKAKVMRGELRLKMPNVPMKGKIVLVVDDGPTITHGGMPYGAGYIAAKQYGAKIIEPRAWAVGSIKETYAKYPHIGSVLPALGYTKQQVSELEKTINACDAEIIVNGSPFDIARVVNTKKTIVNVEYSFSDSGKAAEKAILRFLQR
jgi:predicted GTPase